MLNLLVRGLKWFEYDLIRLGLQAFSLPFPPWGKSKFLCLFWDRPLYIILGF
jgi:hypothetical protein